MNKPNITFHPDGRRFISNEAIVTTALAFDDMLAPVAMMLGSRQRGLIANAARLYMVDGRQGRIAMVDCKRPWLWVDWADDIAAMLQTDMHGVTCDMMPWRRWFTVPDQSTEAKATDTPKAKPAKPIPHRAPYWWDGTGAAPVRCTDCTLYRGTAGWCAAAGKVAGFSHWRRCEAYSERRATFEARLNPDTQGAIIKRIQERLRDAGHDELAKFARVDDCGEISFWGGIPEDAKSAVLPILRGVMV